MTSYQNLDIETLKQMALNLEASEVLVESNAGTYGETECLAAVGTRDSAYGDYQIWQCVGTGARRHVGCDPARAPGYARQTGDLERAQRDLHEIRARIAELRNSPNYRPLYA